MAPSRVQEHVPSSENGKTSYGETAVDKIVQEEKKEASSVEVLSNEEELVLKTFRLLIADLCQQFSGGHPGYVVLCHRSEIG